MSSNSPPPRANRMHIGDDMLDSPRRLPQLTASSGSTVNSPQRPPSSVSARTFSTGPLRRPGQHTPLPPPQAPGLNVTRSPVPTVAAATVVAEATPTAAVRTAAATTASAASSAQREKAEETPRQQHRQQQHYHLVAVDASPAIAVTPSAPPSGAPASAPASTEKAAAISSPPPPAAAAAASTAVPARATSSLLPPWARLDTSAPQGEPSPAAYVMGLWDALAAATLARTTAARAAAYMAPILRNASSFSLDRGGSAGGDGGHGPSSPGGYAHEGAARYSSSHHRHPRHHGHRSGGGGDDGAPRTRSGSGSDASCSQHSALPPPPLVSVHATHAPYQASPFVPASLIEWVPVPGWDDTEMCADGAGGYFKVDAATGEQYRVAYTAQRDLSRPPTVSSSGAATPSSPSPMPSDGRPAGAAGGGAASASAAAGSGGGEGGVDGDGVGPISPLEVWQQPSQRHTTALASAAAADAAVTAAETGSPERAYREGTTETVAGVVRRSSAAGGQRHLRFESPLPASLASPPSSSSSCASADAWASEKQTKKKKAEEGGEEAAETTYATPAASVEVSPVTLRDTAAALSTGAEMVAHAAEVPSLQAQRTPRAPLRAESTSAGRHREAVPPRPRQAKSPQRSPVKEIAERVGWGLHTAAAAATAVTRVAAHDSAASIRRADGGRSAEVDGAEMAAAGVTDDDDAGDGGDDEEDGDGDDGTARDGDDDAAAHPPSSSSYVYPWLSSSNRASGTSWGSERNHSRFCFSAELIARKSLPVESDGYGAHGCSVFTGVRTDGTVSVVMLEPYPTPFAVRRPAPLSTPPPPTTTNATASTTADGAAHAQPSAHRQEKTWPSAAPPWSPNLPDRPLSFIGRSPSRRRAHTTYEFPPSRPPVSHPPRDTQPPSASSQERGEGERVAAATLPLTSTGLSSLLCSKAGLALTPPPRLPQPRTFPSPQFSPPPPPPPPHASAQAPQHPPSLALGYGVLPASNSRLPRSVASTAHTSADATTTAADAALTVGGAQSAHPQRIPGTTARTASGEAGEREASPAHTGLLAASRAASYGHGGTAPYLLPATAQGLWSPMAPSSSPVLPLSLKMRQTANSTHSTAAAAAAAAASSSPGGPPSGVAPPPAQSSASRAAGAETHPSAVPVQTLNAPSTTPPAVAAAPSPAGAVAGEHDAVAAFMLAAARARGQWRPSQSYPPAAAAAAASGVTTTPAPPPSTHQLNTAPPTAPAATAAVRAAEEPAAGPSRAGRATLPESDAAATDSASRPLQLSVAALSSTDAEPPPPAPPPPPTTGAAAAQRTAAPTSLLPSWCVALADTLLTPPSTVRHVAHNATASGLGPPMPAAVIGPSMQQLHQQKLLQQQQQQQQAENAAAAAAARTPSAPSPVSRATTSGSDPDSHTWSVETRNGVTIGWTHKAVTAAERARKAAATAATAAATAAAVASDSCDAALQAVGGAGDEGERGGGVANLRGGDGGAFLEVRDGGGVASAISSTSPSGDTATSRTSSSPVPFCLATPLIGHVAQAARVVPGGGGVGRDAPRRAEARVLESKRRRQEKKHPEEEEEEGEELQEPQEEEEEEGKAHGRGTKAVYGDVGTERVVDATADTEASILTPSAHNVVAAALRTDAAELRRRVEEEERDDVAAATAAADDNGEDHDLVRHCPARHPPMVQLPVFTPEPGPRRNTRVSILTHSGLNVQGSINDVSAAATATAAAATHVTPAHPPMHVRFTNTPVLPHHGERDGAAAFSKTITTTTVEEEEEEAMMAGQRPGSGGDAVGGHGQCKEVPEFAAVEQRGEGEPPPTPPQPPAPGGGGGGGGGGDRAPSDWLRTRNVDLSVATTLVRFQQFHQQQQQAMAKKNAATAAHRLMRSLADPPAGATSRERGEEGGDSYAGPPTVSPPPPSRPSQFPYASHQLPSAEVRAPLSLTVPPARAASPPQTAALPSTERSEGGGRVGVAFIVDREAGRDAPPPRLGAAALQSRGQDDENGTETLARLADATARTQAHAYGAPLSSTARQGREGEGDGGSGAVGVPRRPAPPHLVSPAPPPGAIAHTAIVPPESEQTAPSPTAAPPSRRKRLPPPPLVLPQRENELPPPQQQQHEEGEGKETSVRPQQQQYATTGAGGGHIPRRPSAEHTHSYGRPTQHSPR